MPEPQLPKNAGPVEWVGPGDERYSAGELIHCVRLPDGIEPDRPVPALVMVHGRTGDESAMWIFKQVVPRGAAIVTPRGPVDLEEGGYGWFRPAEQRLQADPASLQEGVTRLEHFLTGLPRLYPIDPDQLILVGFSQGAAMINALALTRPRQVAGVVSLAGRVPQLPEMTHAAGGLAGLRVFIAHGAHDDVVPLSDGQRTRDIYTHLGAQVTYNDYPVGHKMNTEGFKDLKAWLEELVKA